MEEQPANRVQGKKKDSGPPVVPGLMCSQQKRGFESKFGGDRYFSTLNGLVHTFIKVGRKCAAMGGRGKKKGEKATVKRRHGRK